ncbi:MAG: hypothetical protein IT292_03160 [Deltaproteobacteria bacterium]|nr:hypothetical protein [Deltaproteobacteria bacterium]
MDGIQLLTELCRLSPSATNAAGKAAVVKLILEALGKYPLRVEQVTFPGGDIGIVARGAFDSLGGIVSSFLLLDSLMAKSGLRGNPLVVLFLPFGHSLSNEWREWVKGWGSRIAAAISMDYPPNNRGTVYIAAPGYAEFQLNSTVPLPCANLADIETGFIDALELATLVNLSARQQIGIPSRMVGMSFSSSEAITNVSAKMKAYPRPSQQLNTLLVIITEKKDLSVRIEKNIPGWRSAEQSREWPAATGLSSIDNGTRPTVLNFLNEGGVNYSLVALDQRETMPAALMNMPK